MTIQKISHAIAKRIARSVIKYRNSGIDVRFLDINAQIDDWLADIGLGWKLKAHTYIDGISHQFIGALAKDIRDNAVQK